MKHLMLIVLLSFMASCIDSKNGKIKTISEYKYSAEQILNDSGKTKSYKSTYKYDKDGNLLESNKYNDDGSFYRRHKYKYDKNGNEIEWNRYNSFGCIYKNVTYEYDKNGNMIRSNRKRKTLESLGFDADCNNRKYNLTYSLYKYDKDGNKTEKSKYQSDTLSSRWTYKYDKKRNLIKEIHYKSDTLTSEKTYRYDENRNRVETIKRKYDNTIVSRKMIKYDKQGNWIRKLTYDTQALYLMKSKDRIVYISKKEIPIWIDERKIEYYKWYRIGL